MRKLVHLQILRAVAASLVVIDHSLAYMRYLGTLPEIYVKAGYLAGDAGVAAFFVLSGLILVRVSYQDFGVPRAGVRFLVRRLVRVAPMYWMTTLLYFFMTVHPTRLGFLPQTHLGLKLLMSVAFLPNLLATDVRLMPLVGQGWTLNYEMAFYCLLALSLGARKRPGILLTILVPVGLTVLGYCIPRGGDDLHKLAAFYTDPMLQLFAAGGLIGWLEIEKKEMPAFRFPFSPAFLLLLPACVAVAFPKLTGAHDLFSWFRLFGLVSVVLCTLSAEPGDGWLNRLWERLGAASYSTYLLHILAIGPICQLAGSLHVQGWPVAIFVALSVVSAHAVGLVVYAVVERPLTERLRGAIRAPRQVAPTWRQGVFALASRSKNNGNG